MVEDNLSSDTPIVAGVELGGTKAIAVVGYGRMILDKVQVPTTTPAETLGALGICLREWQARWNPRALGIASFGPVSIHTGRSDYGHMLPTPKAGWTGADLLGPLDGTIKGPCFLHTDVTAAALAEGRWGAAQQLSDFIYVTIGTGIGIGIIANGQPIAGQMHPEAGHLRVRRMVDDAFPGICPFHGDCLEGLASGPAIAARSGVDGADLTQDDPAWIPIADAIAEAFVSLFLTLAPQAIVVGGGVGTGQRHLLEKVRTGVAQKLGDYLPHVEETALARMIMPAALGGQAGPVGALMLAEMALIRDQTRNRVDL